MLFQKVLRTLRTSVFNNMHSIFVRCELCFMTAQKSGDCKRWHHDQKKKELINLMRVKRSHE